VTGGAASPVGTRAPTVSRELWVGVDADVPIAGRGRVRYANFDNAASTPALRIVRDKVDELLRWYASVHRGAGFKSRLSTKAYEDARAAVGAFVGADPDRDVVVFTKHTTEAVNLLAAAIELGDGDAVALSVMEHHSNMLPWRRRGPVEYIEVGRSGEIDLDSLELVLRRGKGRVKLVALSGASNVTGFVNPVHDAAALAHRYGARILVDGAQLAAHRPIRMRPHDDPGHLDFLAFSGHKIYAPFGAGALVVPRTVLETGAPLLAGGGAVKIVSRDHVLWDEAPERNEAGSPNVVGAVALGVAVKAVERLGFDAVEDVEADLTRRTLRGLAAIDGVSILGSADPDRLEDRLGVITFTVAGLHHSYVASVLSNEWGIGVRDGCFCAHPYVIDLLRVPDEEVDRVRHQIAAGDRRSVPGATRVSFAPYNEASEVDRFLNGMQAIAAGDVRLAYAQDPRTGDYDPVDWAPGWQTVFSLEG
jgi:cysteine desulfurase/selenocysteine lyase